MMNNIQMNEAMKKLKEWNLIGSFSVGGFEYMGFSNNNSNKLIIISSQRKTIFDCEDESISDIDAEFDEKELVAITDKSQNQLIFGRMRNIIGSRDLSSPRQRVSPKIKYNLGDD